MSGNTLRSNLETKVKEIEGITNLCIDVHKYSGELNITIKNKDKRKTNFKGSIEECSLYIEGIMACLKILGGVENVSYE